jgi:hypothetical protein
VRQFIIEINIADSFTISVFPTEIALDEGYPYKFVNVNKDARVTFSGEVTVPRCVLFHVNEGELALADNNDINCSVNMAGEIWV